MCRLEKREAASVSDNEEESPIPTPGTFIDIQSALGHPSSSNIICPDAPPSPEHANQVSMDMIDDPTTPNPKLMLGTKGWHELISGCSDTALAADQPSKNAHVNYHSLGPMYSTEQVASNKQLLDMTNIPNAILQMTYNKLYIPLLMLTTSALSMD